MALFSESKLKKLRYPYNTARMVSLVKAIETSDAGGKYWSKTEAEEITAEPGNHSGLQGVGFHPEARRARLLPDVETFPDASHDEAELRLPIACRALPHSRFLPARRFR